MSESSGIQQPVGMGVTDGSEGCCDAKHKPSSHDTSRIAWAKLMARVGEEFPLLCPACGGDIRLIAFITEPGPIRKILIHPGRHPDTIPPLKLFPCPGQPPQNPIHHLLRPGLAGSRWPPFGIQGVADPLKG